MSNRLIVRKVGTPLAIPQEAAKRVFCEGVWHVIKVASAALDVFEVEPVPAGNKLIQHPHFHGTPHIGAATLEAQARVGRDIAHAVMTVLDGKKADTIVNSHLLK